MAKPQEQSLDEMCQQIKSTDTIGKNEEMSSQQFNAALRSFISQTGISGILDAEKVSVDEELLTTVDEILSAVWEKITD